MPAAYTQRGPPVDSNSLHITQAVNTEHEMWAQLQNATVGLTGNFLANNTYGIRIRAAEIKRFEDARSAASRYTTAATFISEATRPLTSNLLSAKAREFHDFLNL